MANIYIGRNTEQLEVGTNVTVDRVIVYVGEESAYYSPSGLTDAQWNAMTGKIVSVTIPFGTQAIADSIRTNLSAITYKPYSATCGDLDPAGDLGDYVTVGGEYSLLAKQVMYLNDRATSDFSAETENSVTDKYPYISSIESSTDRKIADVVSRLTIAEGEIELRVEKDGVISAINQTAETITINASKINLTGYVTATDLATGGSTTINGANITTGTISADRISTSISQVNSALMVGNGISSSPSITFRGSSYGNSYISYASGMTLYDNNAIDITSAGEVEIYGLTGVELNTGYGYIDIYCANGKFWRFSSSGITFHDTSGTQTAHVSLIQD